MKCSKTIAPDDLRYRSEANIGKADTSISLFHLWKGGEDSPNTSTVFIYWHVKTNSVHNHILSRISIDLILNHSLRGRLLGRISHADIVMNFRVIDCLGFGSLSRSFGQAVFNLIDSRSNLSPTHQRSFCAIQCLHKVLFIMPSANFFSGYLSISQVIDQIFPNRNPPCKISLMQQRVVHTSTRRRRPFRSALA